MPKTILTERDIDALKAQGATEIRTNDETYLTDLAFERAEKLGLPVRTVSTAAAADSRAQVDKDQLVAKVKAGVIARLGAGVDEKLVETIVRRVVGKL